MYDRKMWVERFIVDQEKMQAAEAATMKRIERNKLEIILLRRLVSLNGRYVTKRIDPQLQALFPEFEKVYLGKSSSYTHTLSARIYARQNDWINLDIATDENRRVSLEMINKQIEMRESEIQADYAALEVFRENAAQWNNLMAYAATIYSPICHVLYNDPRNTNDAILRL